MKRLRRHTRNVWILVKGYWQSEERLSATLLLIAIIGLNLGLVGVNVLQNRANGTLFNSLQGQDAPGFYRAFVTVVLLIMVYLVVAVLRVYLGQILQLRWRRWMTDQYITRWLGNRAFYRMRFSGNIDNPDQRISEDVRLFIERFMALALGFLNSLATLASFAALLWYLSGSISFSLGGMEITIPGYMFWVAVLYSGLGSVFAHLIGRPLIRLNNRQQAVEADFRFSLVRLREEAEGIALYSGEAEEHSIALARFRALYRNFKQIILRSNQFLMFQLFFSQGTSSFALLIASPRFFSGAIQLGALTQIANAFERVNEALSWFIGSYTAFAEWWATAERLIDFSAEIDREAAAKAQGASTATGPQDTIDLHNVGVSLPDGSILLAPMSLSFKPRQSVLLRGTSGSGKSTLFRLLAGLWPFSAGRISMPADAKMLFLPQRPYLPIGSLRKALWFPTKPLKTRDEEAQAALAAVGLTALTQRLDQIAHWAQVLSLGEQQRFAIAGALLIKPDWLFLDEATSATDEEEEAVLYRTIADTLPGTTVVSIGHRGALEAYHDRIISVDRVAGKPGRLVDRAAPDSVRLTRSKAQPPKVQPPKARPPKAQGTEVQRPKVQRPKVQP